MNTPKIVYIAVHPYSFWRGEDVYSDQPHFTKVRERRLSDRSLDQILFVENDDINDIKRKILVSDPYWKNKVFLTHLVEKKSKRSSAYWEQQKEKVIHLATHREMGWKEVSSMIQRQYHSREYQVWGAELNINVSRKSISGCVALTAIYLQLPNLSVSEKDCWIHREKA